MVYVNNLKCMSRLFNALFQQLYVWETVGLVDELGRFVGREEMLLEYIIKRNYV